ncbi:MAG: hypothetical protein GY811_02140 [Myxococcales bacterium]|nr:hypothetical protein [Myxococcales bacterium]
MMTPLEPSRFKSKGTNGVDYLIGLAKNSRLKSMLAKPSERAHREHLRTGDASRAFKEIRYRTQETWSCTRRVIGKAEHLSKGANPRFVVTSLSSKEFEKRYVYEDRWRRPGDATPEHLTTQAPM